MDTHFSRLIIFLIFTGVPVVGNAQPPDPNQVLFDEAMEKRDSGKLFDAIEMFETMLGQNPDLDRVRLELAVAYHRASLYEAAVTEFKTVLDNPDTPESVRLSILAYLAQLKKDQESPDSRHQVAYYIKAGLLSDSNINATPGNITNQFGGLIYTTPSKISSTGLDFDVAATHRYSQVSPLNMGGTDTRFEWQSQLALSSKTYEKVSDYNLQILSLSTGPTLYSAGRWRALINFKVDKIKLGGNDLATFSSVDPAVIFDFGYFRSMLVEASFLSRDYDDVANNGRNGDETMIGAGYTTYLSHIGAGFEAGIRLSSNDTNLAEFSYQSQELYFGSFMPIFDTTNAYLNLNLRMYDYDAADTISGLVRDETESYLAIGINHDYMDGWLKNWALNAEVSATENDSNVPQFDFKRTQVNLNLSRHFR